MLSFAAFLAGFRQAEARYLLPHGLRARQAVAPEGSCSCCVVLVLILGKGFPSVCSAAVWYEAGSAFGHCAEQLHTGTIVNTVDGIGCSSCC